MRINHKIKLNFKDYSLDILYERPSVSANGERLTCVVSQDYGLSDSDLISIHINNDEPFVVTPRVTNFVEQGWVELNTSYKLLTHSITDNNETWLYYIGNDGLFKSCHLTDADTGDCIVYGYEHDIHGRFDKETWTISVPTRYYIENGVITYVNGLEYYVEYDEKGVFPIQEIFGQTVVIHNGATALWQQKSRLEFVLPQPVDIKIHDVQCMKYEYFINVDGIEIILSERWIDAHYPTGNVSYVQRFIDAATVKKYGLVSDYFRVVTSDNDLIEVTEETMGQLDPIIVEIPDEEGNLEDIFDYTNVIEVNHGIRTIQKREIRADNGGELLFVYIDSDDINFDPKTNYLIAERLTNDMNYYTMSEDGEVNIDGVTYHADTVFTIDYDGMKEVTETVLNVETGSGVTETTMYYILLNDTPYYLYRTDGDGNRIPQSSIGKLSDLAQNEDITEVYFTPVISLSTDNIILTATKKNKIVVDSVEYFKDVDVFREIIYEDDEDGTEHYIPQNAVSYFEIPAVKRYYIDLLEFRNANLFIGHVRLDPEYYAGRNGLSLVRSIHQDIVFYKEDFVFKLPYPTFDVDKTKDAVIQRIITPDGFRVIDNNQSISLAKVQAEIVLPCAFSFTHGTNLFQEMWVKDKFVEEEINKRINHIVDMEKDIYFPSIMDDKGNLTDALKVEFYLHFRSRNSEWVVNEDYITHYEETFNEAEVDVNPQDENVITDIVKNSWNIWDSYNPREVFTDFPYYQPSDLLGFLDFDDNDIFYQKSKIGKSFLRLMFYDSPNPKTQSLLASSTIFMEAASLFGKYSDLSTNPLKVMNYFNPLDSQMKSKYVTCDYEPYNGNLGVTAVTPSFNETYRLSSKMVIDGSKTVNSSAEGFYTYIFREYSSGLHERTIYMRVQFNHAGHGTVIDLLQPMVKNSVGELELINFKQPEQLDAFKQGVNLDSLYESMFIPIKVKYNENKKQYCWYLPHSLSKNTNQPTDSKDTIRFNLYEIKIKN